MTTIAEIKAEITRLEGVQATQTKAKEKAETGKQISDLSIKLEEMEEAEKAGMMADKHEDADAKLLTPYSATPEEFKAKVEAFNAKVGGRLILSGLGLLDGEYHFATSDEPIFQGYRGVESKKNPKAPQVFTLTYLAGTVTGNNINPIKYDLVDRLFVVSANHAMEAKPGTGYKFTVVEGRITTFSEVLELETA